MGRAHQVREKAIAASSARKSAMNMRASKEIYMAARSGVPDPNSNLALRSAIEKYKAMQIPRDVIERAIKKAQGGAQETYIAGRYEAIGQGGSYVIIDTLSDNQNRALVEVRTMVTKKGGHLSVPGSVAFNFTETGLIILNSDKRDEIEENLILGDVDVTEVTQEDTSIVIKVNPTFLNAAKVVLSEMGLTEYDTCEITMEPNELISLEGEQLEKFKQMIDGLEELQDVQNVYHNVNLED